MLVRILIIVDDAALERRLVRIFEPPETAVAPAPHKAVLWDRVKAFPTDLVVIGRSSLAEPIEATVETIQSLPERPEVIVVGASDSRSPCFPAIKHTRDIRMVDQCRSASNLATTACVSMPGLMIFRATLRRTGRVPPCTRYVKDRFFVELLAAHGSFTPDLFEMREKPSAASLCENQRPRPQRLFHENQEWLPPSIFSRMQDRA